MTTVTIPVREIELDTSEGSNLRVAIEESNGIRYWAVRLMVDDAGVRVVGFNEGPTCTLWKARADWNRVAESIALLASGQFVDYDGEKKPLRNEYIVKAAHDFLHNPDEVDYDIDVMDMILQLSLLGRVVYG